MWESDSGQAIRPGRGAGVGPREEGLPRLRPISMDLFTKKAACFAHRNTFRVFAASERRTSP